MSQGQNRFPNASRRRGSLWVQVGAIRNTSRSRPLWSRSRPTQNR